MFQAWIWWAEVWGLENEDRRPTAEETKDPQRDHFLLWIKLD